MKTKVVWPLTLGAATLSAAAILLVLSLVFDQRAAGYAGLFFIMSLFQYSLAYWAYEEGRAR